MLSSSSTPLTEYCYRNYNSGGNSGFKWSVSLPEGPLLWVGGSDRSKTTTWTHSTSTNLLQGASMYSEARPAALHSLQRTSAPSSEPLYTLQRTRRLQLQCCTQRVIARCSCQLHRLSKMTLCMLSGSSPVLILSPAPGAREQSRGTTSTENCTP